MYKCVSNKLQIKFENIIFFLFLILNKYEFLKRSQERGMG